jgi:phosphoserine phosphatase RsbU/P
MSELDILKKKISREKLSRQEAETLLEQKSLELYYAQQQLKKANEEILGRIQVLDNNLLKTKEMLDDANQHRRFVEARNQAILDTAVDAIITIDTHGCIESFNKAAETIFGYSQDEVLGKNVSLLMDTPNRENHDQYINNYLQTHTAKVLGKGREVIGLHKNGSPISLHLAVSEIQISGKHLFTGIIRDITDIKKTQNELEEARRQEKQIGGQIQQMLLLGKPPQNMAGLQISAFTLPSRDVNGDFYDFLRHSEQCCDIILGDVMGKGIPAALIGSGTKSKILRIFSQLCLQENTQDIPSPVDIISYLLENMFKDLKELDSFVTLCYARFDMERRVVRFIDCGHTKTIHYHKKLDKCDTIFSNNLPLGFLENDPYEEIIIPFDDGDVFLFYSDGITEAQDMNDEMFGENRLIDLVSKQCQNSPDDLLDYILNHLHTFCQKDYFSDDFSCIAVRIGNDSVKKAIGIKKSFPGNTSQLESIREFTSRYCETLNLFNTDQVDQCMLAVQETVTNVIKHVYDQDIEKTITIAMQINMDELVITLIYEGESFDPIPKMQTEFNQLQESGFGLYIIEQCMDRVQYFTDLHGFQNIRMYKSAKRIS